MVKTNFTQNPVLNLIEPSTNIVLRVYSKVMGETG